MAGLTGCGVPSGSARNQPFRQKSAAVGFFGCQSVDRRKSKNKKNDGKQNKKDIFSCFFHYNPKSSNCSLNSWMASLGVFARLTTPSTALCISFLVPFSSGEDQLLAISACFQNTSNPLLGVPSEIKSLLAGGLPVSSEYFFAPSFEARKSKSSQAACGLLVARETEAKKYRP